MSSLRSVELWLGKQVSGVGCQVSGVRIDDGVRFWGFMRDVMATKDFLDVEDLEVYCMKNIEIAIKSA